jgi:hypothetical protein
MKRRDAPVPRRATPSPVVAVLVILLAALPAAAGEPAVLFREDFTTLDGWKPFFFPKIKSHSTYTVERDGDRHRLRSESNASASAIVYKEAFDVQRYPVIRWRWKIGNVYAAGDPRSKKGDDYPLRVYVMFEYDPDGAGLGERITYGLAKALYGEYPPHSSLSYVWASRTEKERIITSPYTDKAKMVLLRSGPELVGTWQEERVNILDDYREAFGTNPPARARIAIMNDSDNTGERSVSWMEYIEVLP